MDYPIDKYKCYGYDEKNEDGSVRCQCVVAIASYAGKPVKGVAKCHPEDEWNWEKGRDLAIARCAEKIAIKRANRATSKLCEAREAMAKAVADSMNQVIDMTNYFLDATAEVLEASAEVDEILAKM